ncbi:MAG: hypothetical protein IH620_03490, partial [Ignavibacterium sp.]|nr:hypothetical protein [Ignavibacterium sp.]
MKKIIYYLLITIIVNSYSYSQERDSLIQLYPGMGDTLDFIDREIFNLYQDVDEYKYAQLFLRDNKFFVSKIYSNYGKVRDKVLVEDISEFKDLQMKLYQIILDNEKKFQSPSNASILLDNCNSYNGKLEMFSKKYLYFNSEMDYLTGNSSPFRFKTSLQKVDSLRIQAKKPDLLPYVAYGALGGAIIGVAIGVYWANNYENLREGYDKYMIGISGLIAAGIGAFVGYIINTSVPKDFISIKINSTNDLINLKDYAPYY